MKFHDLIIENFLTIKTSKVNLADRGLQLIQGVNEADSSATSNGSGKSTLVDAICWCLYGLTARGVKSDDVVSLLTGKNCLVSLTMSNGASHYRVTRHRKHATGKNSLTVALMSAVPHLPLTDLSLSRGTDAETQKVLEKLLGCSYEVFVAAVYSGQENMPDLPKMKDRELKTLIEEAAGLQRIEKAYEIARERANICKSEEALAGDRRATLHANMTRFESSLVDVQQRHDEWGEVRALRVAETQGSVDAAKALLEKLDIAAKELTEPSRLAAERIDKIELALGSHRVAEKATLAADVAVRKAEMSIDATLLKRLAAQVKHFETLIANASEEIKKPCTECGTVLQTMSLEEFVAHRTEHLNSAKLKLEEGKATATAQVKELLTLRAVAKTAREAIPDVTALVAEKSDLAKSVTARTVAVAAVSRALADFKAAETQLALRETEPNPNASALALCNDHISKTLAQLVSSDIAFGALEKAREISAAVVKVFGPAGVRAQILDTVTPFLNERTADYLSALTDGNAHATWTTLTKSASGDLKEKFSIDVSHDLGGDSFLAISGGEKRKVRLATALALQDLVASRATQPIDFWCGDEIDDALDPAGLERLMTILERRARERGTVLVISHSDLKDWCDEVTTVRKTAKWNSVVEGSLCS